MSPNPSPPDVTAQHVPAPDPGTPRPHGTGRVGAYRLLEALGEGGMGTVYLAEQHEPVRRRVALKLIKPGMDSAQVVARFEAERQALALMDHPNIAKVLDAGTTDDGHPYFVMELVKGVPITKLCDDMRLTVRERAELFIRVCHAVQHAHQKGIIHRDIKPSNVLVALVDGKPEPKVIDFGVAKAVEQPLTDRTVYTQLGAAVGTWEYMSPEQAECSPLGVDTRSDVYSLGVLLYELLTGTTPLRREGAAGGYSEMLRRIREVDPPVPSARLSSGDAPATVAHRRRVEPVARLAKLVRGELDVIAMTALAKDRGERYASANELADDVRRYLDGDPVKAVPPSARYRLKKFLRRNKGAVAAGCAVLLALVGGVVASAWQADRARTERDRAVASQQALQLTLTRQVADRMEADLMRLSAVGHAMAAIVEQGTIRDEEQLSEWKVRMLQTEPQIYGLFVGFEPDTFDLRPDLAATRVRAAAKPGANYRDPHRDGYTLYVYRKGPERKVVAEALTVDYDYRPRGWYRDTLNGIRFGWREPYHDLYAGDSPMVSAVMPLKGKGSPQPIGVLTVDLALDYFRQLATWLKELNFGESSYGFVVSAEGRIIGHPHLEAKRYARKDGELVATLLDVWGADADFRAIVGRILAHDGRDVGQAVGTDPATGQSSRFLYAKFRPAGWYFVAVLPEVR